MQPDDLDAVVEIESLSFPTAWPREGYEHEITRNKQAAYFVLVHADPDRSPIIGYAGYWLMGDESHISIIAVSPTWRGQGLGELLLLQLLFHALAAGASLATLEVRESNEVAQALYRKYQFAVVGRRKGYYKDTGEDALLMTVTWEDRDDYRQQLRRAGRNLWQRLHADDEPVSDE
jgi:ribosomal-protein-alanine N-acetyltransferase